MVMVMMPMATTIMVFCAVAIVCAITSFTTITFVFAIATVTTVTAIFPNVNIYVKIDNLVIFIFFQEFFIAGNVWQLMTCDNQIFHFVI